MSSFLLLPAICPSSYNVHFVSEMENSSSFVKLFFSNSAHLGSKDYILLLLIPLALVHTMFHSNFVNCQRSNERNSAAQCIYSLGSTAAAQQNLPHPWHLLKTRQSVRWPTSFIFDDMATLAVVVVFPYRHLNGSSFIPFSTAFVRVGARKFESYSRPQPICEL
jgi:hypothetical protein